MHRHPWVPWKQAATARPVLNIQSKKPVLYDISPSFSTWAESKGRLSCWIIAGASPFSCSRRPLDKEMHHVTIMIFCKCCKPHQETSKTCVQSGTNALIDIITSWLDSQTSDTAPYIHQSRSIPSHCQQVRGMFRRARARCMFRWF